MWSFSHLPRASVGVDLECWEANGVAAIVGVVGGDEVVNDVVVIIPRHNGVLSFHVQDGALQRVAVQSVGAVPITRVAEAMHVPLATQHNSTNTWQWLDKSGPIVRASDNIPRSL